MESDISVTMIKSDSNMTLKDSDSCVIESDTDVENAKLFFCFSPYLLINQI